MKTRLPDPASSLPQAAGSNSRSLEYCTELCMSTSKQISKISLLHYFLYFFSFSFALYKLWSTPPRSESTLPNHRQSAFWSGTGEFDLEMCLRVRCTVHFPCQSDKLSIWYTSHIISDVSTLESCVNLVRPTAHWLCYGWKLMYFLCIDEEAAKATTKLYTWRNSITTQ